MKKTMIMTAFLCVTSAVVLPNKALATGIPTIDIANILQTSLTAFESIEQTATMLDQMNQMVKQYEQQIKTLESMTGSRGMGEILTSLQKSQDRRWAPSDIDQALATIRAGGIPGTNQNYGTAITRMKNATGSLSSNEMSMASDGYMASYGGYYDEYRASNLAAVGLSEGSYSDNEKRVAEIEDLIARIDTANDQKAALDLMNTLMSQMLLLQNESLRLQSALLQNQATANLNQTQAATMEAKFHNRGNL